ncbi:armadillo repeat-containing protein [Pseudoscourfieldia marina]
MVATSTSTAATTLRERVPLAEPAESSAVGPATATIRFPTRPYVPAENDAMDLRDVKSFHGAAAVVANAIDAYRTARLTFISTMHKLALKPDEATLKAILDQDVLALLCAPPVKDAAPSVRYWTMQVLEALSSRAPSVPPTLAGAGVLQNMLPSLRHDRVKVRESTLQALLRLVNVGGADLSLSLVECGALPLLTEQLKFFDLSVRELSIRVMSAIVRASDETARAVATPELLESLVGNMSGHDAVNLKEAAVATLANVAAVDPQLAALVQEAGVVAPAVALSRDEVPDRLRASALLCLAQISRHSNELAETCASAGAHNAAVSALVHTAGSVRTSGAKLALMLCRRNARLSKAMMDAGACAALVRCVSSNHHSASPEALDSCVALGHLAGADPDFAAAVVRANGVIALSHGLTSKAKSLQTGAAWSLGKVASASASCARTLAEKIVHDKLRPLAVKRAGARTPAMEAAGAPPAPVPDGADAEVTEALGRHASECLLTVARSSDHLPTLTALCSPEVPWDVAREAAVSLARLLPSDPAARRDFVSVGALKRLAELAKMCVVFAESAATMDARNMDKGSTPDGRSPLDQGAWPDAEAVAKRQLLEAARSVFGLYPEDVLGHYGAAHLTTVAAGA